MTLRRWCIVLGLGIATVVCGTVGLVLYGRAHRHDAEGLMEIPQAFYHSLQMLLLHTPHLEHGPNWWILAGEFFGAATALLTVVFLLHHRARRELQRFWLRFAEEHIVVCGIGDRGLEIVRRFGPALNLPLHTRWLEALKRLVRRLTAAVQRVARVALWREGAQGCNAARDFSNACAGGGGCGNREFHVHEIVVIDPAPDESVREKLEQAGVCVLKGDATEREVLLRARVARASQIFVITGSDQTNLAIAAAAFEASKDGRPPECRVHLANANLRQAFDASLDGTEDHPAARPHFFDVFDRAARRVFRDHPLDGAGIGRTDTTQVHLVVIGFGKMGRSLALNAARLGHFANGKPLRISIVDRHGTAKEETFHFRHPAFREHEFCVLDFHQLDAASAACARQMEAWADEPDTRMHVCFCLDDDMQSLELALRFQKTLARTDSLLVRIRARPSISDIIKVAANEPQIAVFSTADETGDDEELDAVARAIHGAFVKSQVPDPAEYAAKVAKNYALRPWNELRDDFRDSNRQQADHLFIKLRALGYDLADRGKIPPGATPADDVKAADFTPLAPLEHTRWNAERWLAGWRLPPPGPRDEDADKKNRVSPYLVKWEHVPLKIQQYDVEAVENIPALIRDFLPGKVIIRTAAAGRRA